MTCAILNTLCRCSFIARARAPAMLPRIKIEVKAARDLLRRMRETDYSREDHSACSACSDASHSRDIAARPLPPSPLRRAVQIRCSRGVRRYALIKPPLSVCGATYIPHISAASPPIHPPPLSLSPSLSLSLRCSMSFLLFPGDVIFTRAMRH